MSDKVSESELKKLFALAWLREPANPFAAACIVFGSDTGKALWAARDWITDAEVLHIREELLAEHGERAFLPSKEELARKVIAFAEEKTGTGMSIHASEVRLKAYELYAKIMGHIEKPGVTVDARQGVFNDKVMVVKDHGSDDDWERAAATQQERLTNAAAPATKH